MRNKRRLYLQNLFYLYFKSERIIYFILFIVVHCLYNYPRIVLATCPSCRTFLIEITVLVSYVSQRVTAASPRSKGKQRQQEENRSRVGFLHTARGWRSSQKDLDRPCDGPSSGRLEISRDRRGPRSRSSSLSSFSRSFATKASSVLQLQIYAKI